MEDFSIKRTRNTIKIFFAIFNTTIITPKNKVRLAKSKFLNYIREAVFFYKDVYSYNILEGHLVGERKMSRAQLRSQQYSTIMMLHHTNTLHSMEDFGFNYNAYHPQIWTGLCT